MIFESRNTRVIRDLQQRVDNQASQISELRQEVNWRKRDAEQLREQFMTLNAQFQGMLKEQELEMVLVPATPDTWATKWTGEDEESSYE